MSAVPLAAQAFCVCPVIVTDRLRAPPQACRKIHDCDAAAGESLELLQARR